MMKKIMLFCLTALMVFSIFAGLSGCANNKTPRNDSSAGNGAATGGAENEDEQKYEEIEENVQDVMNEMFDREDSGLSEEEKSMANDLFDMFTD